MKIKVTFLLALLLVGFIYIFATVNHEPIVGDASAKSTPRNVGVDCADRKDCYIAIQKTTQNTMCRFNTNDAWSWLLDENGDKQPCGGGNTDKDPDPSNTPAVVVVPTNTAGPIFPTNTDVPAQKQPTITPEQNNDEGNGGGSKPTITPTCTPGPGQDPDDDCDMCEQLSTVAAAQATLAAEASKGD